MPILETITTDEIADRYDAVLLDSSGVLVDGQSALSGAADFLALLEARQTPWLVVTNDASRQPNDAAKGYQEKGLPIPKEQILSSGMMIVPYLCTKGVEAGPVCVLGPAGTRSYLTKAGYELVSPGDDRAQALIIGSIQGYDFIDGVRRSLSMLVRAFNQGRPVELICANPDFIFPASPGEVGFTAGAVAALFEASLQPRFPARIIEFARIGKPGPMLFERAKERFSGKKLLMVGDQLHTDILGAQEAGIDSVLITKDVVDLRAATRQMGVVPTYIMPSL